jgi:diguanylate cyclase (GGDEF)-like protein
MFACAGSGWSFSAPVLLTLLVGLGVTVLGRWIKLRRRFAGSDAFRLMHIAILWWLGAAALEMSVHHQDCKMFWAGMAWPAILAVPTFWALFLWQYINSIHTPIKPLAITGILAMPSLFWLLAMTNPWHWQFYGRDSAPITAEVGAPIAYQHEWLFYMAAAYGYPFMLFCIGITLRAAMASKGVHRRQFLIFLLLTTVPWIANISYVLFDWSLFGFDPTPFSFAITLAGFGWLITGMRLFDLLPVARHLLLDALIDPVLVVDPQHRVIEANPAALRLAGLDRKWQGRALVSWPLIGEALDKLLRHDALVEATHVLNLEARGQHYEVRVREITKVEPDGILVLGWMLYLRDVTEYQHSQRQLAESLALSKQQLETISALLDTLQSQALRDPLTGLFNRRYLDDFFTLEVARAQRDATPIALAMLDLDHFKRLNDTHGHGAGDDALKGVAAFLQEGLRATDAVFRIGGEEFLLVLPRTHAREALEKLQHLCSQFAELDVQTRAGRLRLTMSVGLALYPSQANDLDGLMQQADAQLYRAKHHGRNRVALCLEGETDGQ